MAVGQTVSEAQVEALPDPETFMDALDIAWHGTWTPSELDGADALLVALVRKLRGARKVASHG